MMFSTEPMPIPGRDVGENVEVATVGCAKVEISIRANVSLSRHDGQPDISLAIVYRQVALLAKGGLGRWRARNESWAR